MEILTEEYFIDAEGAWRCPFGFVDDRQTQWCRARGCARDARCSPGDFITCQRSIKRLLGKTEPRALKEVSCPSV